MALIAPQPAVASIHTYHEQPGQTTLRSRQSLRDQNDLAWQATLFKRYHDGADPSLYLRLVGFPGQVTIAPRQKPAGNYRHPGRVECFTQPGCKKRRHCLLMSGQYRFDQVVAELREAIPLTLVVPLNSGTTARLVVAPFVVQEWLQLNRMEPAIRFPD